MSSSPGTSETGGISRRKLLLAFGLLTVAVFALTETEEDAFGESDDIRQVLERHVEALEAGDLDGYLATLAPDSPVTEAAAAERIEDRPERVELFVGAVDRDGDEATAEVVLEFHEGDTAGRQLVRTYTLTRDEDWSIYDWETTERRPRQNG